MKREIYDLKEIWTHIMNILDQVSYINSPEDLWHQICWSSRFLMKIQIQPIPLLLNRVQFELSGLVYLLKHKSFLCEQLIGYMMSSFSWQFYYVFNIRNAWCLPTNINGFHVCQICFHCLSNNVFSCLLSMLSSAFSFVLYFVFLNRQLREEDFI